MVNGRKIAESREERRIVEKERRKRGLKGTKEAWWERNKGSMVEKERRKHGGKGMTEA